MAEKIRVIIADDQNISRGFFEMYVQAASNYSLVHGFRTAQDALDYLSEHEADLLILDVMMQEGIDGLSAAQEIKKKRPELKIILTTSTSETSWEEQARSIGVESFWYKEYDKSGILEVMNRTMAGERVYPNTAPNVPFGKITRAELTERELEVLRALSASLTNEEIATKLCISANTVKRHLQNIMEKTGFESRLDLAMNVKSLGLVVSDETRTQSAYDKLEREERASNGIF